VSAARAALQAGLPAVRHLLGQQNRQEVTIRPVLFLGPIREAELKGTQWIAIEVLLYGLAISDLCAFGLCVLGASSAPHCEPATRCAGNKLQHTLCASYS
jgi:hypothetical protein